MSYIVDQITASAISFVVAGNSGICAFLTLFILGCVERHDETLLNMDGAMEKILASWPAIVLLGVMTILEFIAMCVPVVDEITDAIMTAIIPIISMLGTIGTFGLYGDSSSGNDNGRALGEDGGGLLGFWKFCVVGTGIGLAITMHLFKMLIRLIGVGWLTNLLTILETTWCTCTLILVIMIRAFSIFFATAIIGAAVWVWYRRWKRSKKEEQEEEEIRKQQLLQLTDQQKSMKHLFGSLVSGSGNKTSENGNGSGSDSKADNNTSFVAMP